MVKKLLQIDFPYQGTMGDEMTAALKDIAHSIQQEPGLIWKIWTENEQTLEGGGIYLFEDEASARAYLTMHSQRLKEMGVQNIRSRLFDINMPLSAINQAPV